MINNSNKLGLEVAHRTKWDGYEIIEAFIIALEDANFHTESRRIAKTIYDMYKKDKGNSKAFMEFIAMYAGEN